MTSTQKNAISSPNTPSQTGAHAPRGQLGLWKLLRLRRQQGRSGEELPPAPPPAEASCVSEVFSRPLFELWATGPPGAVPRPVTALRVPTEGASSPVWSFLWSLWCC